MTPAQAGALMRRGRTLLRKGTITAKQFVLLDCLVFSCRPTGADQCSVSFTRLAKLARMSRDTVRLGLAKLEALRLLGRTRRRIRVRWGLVLASRQATNIYTLLAPATEADRRPVYREQVSKKGSALEGALARLGSALRSAAVPGA